MKPSIIKNLLLAVNSTSNFVGEKYPFGNKDLTKKLKDLEHERKIEFDVYTSRWVLKRGKS